MMIFRNHDGREIQRIRDTRSVDSYFRDANLSSIDCYCNETGEYLGAYMRDPTARDEIGFQQADFSD